MKKLRYIGYVRKSTEDEERQILSRAAQRDKIVERFGELDIIDILEESKSAFEPGKRPVFESILEMIDSNEVDGIIAWHPDRLSRNEIDASAITYRIRRGSLQDLKFASFNFDNSPEGMMMLQMTMSQSQYFSAKLSKDVRRGNEKKRQIGGLTGRAPEGYLNQNSNVVVDDLRFPLIRRAFDLFLTGEYSVLKITDLLNEEWGYRTVKRQKSGGGKLARSTLYNIFRNVRYAGLIPDPYDCDKFYAANFPAMITRAEFDQIQNLLGRSGLPRMTKGKTFALRGFLYCGDCGCAITAQSKNKNLKDGSIRVHTYYHCTGRRGNCSQKSNYIKEQDLESQILELLGQYELTTQMLEWATTTLQDLNANVVGEKSHEQAMRHKTIDGLRTQMDKLLDMATRGIITDSLYIEKSAELKASLEHHEQLSVSSIHKSRDWFQIANDSFRKLTDATEKFNNGELMDKKEILLAIGQNPVIIDKKLHLTPNKWLIPVKKTAPSIRAESMRVRTAPQQIRNASELAIMSSWQGHVESNHDPRFWRPMY